MSLPVAQVKSWAAELGFDACRIARAREATHADQFRDWLAAGHHGGMAWLERTPERRCDPRQVLPACRSVICLALNYFPGDLHPPEGSADVCVNASGVRKQGGGQNARATVARAFCPEPSFQEPGCNDPLPPSAPGYRIARYAWNDDYHELIEKRLREFDLKLQTLGGAQKPYVDTGPVLERDFASDAGLGWNGKSTLQIHPRLGTWFFLAEILTTLDLEPDPPLGDHCGKCTRCLTACPTQAITAPHHVDARRCISYLTIEHQGPIPLEFREALGDRIYGCDACLEACPWNRFAVQARELAFHARQSIFEKSLRDFLALDDAAFRALFAKSPIKRLKRPRFLRNVCVALGNTGGPADLPALIRAAADLDPLVSEHAFWAIQQIRDRQS